jgi:acyl-CoA dehydrogenase
MKFFLNASSYVRICNGNAPCCKVTWMKLTDEQLEYQKLARDFAQREIAPFAVSSDKNAATPATLIEKIKELGLMNVRIPDKWGGLGLSVHDAAIIAEEFSTGCPGIASIVICSEIALTPALLMGSDSLKELVLSSVASEAAFLGCAPSGNELTSGMTATADKNGYTLRGEVRLMQNLTLAKYFLVIAKLPSTGSSAPDLVAADLVAAYVPAQSKGVSIKPIEKPLGLRAIDIGTLSLQDVAIPNDQIIHLSKKLGSLEEMANCNHPISAAGAVGLANAALSHAIKYSKERKTFGVPISQHQGVAFLLADMKKEIEAARLLIWRAAKCADTGIFDQSLSLSCKAQSQGMAMQVATDAVQIYGGYGYSKEYPVEKLMRDAKAYDVYNGTAQAHIAELGKQLLHSH